MPSSGYEDGSPANTKDTKEAEFSEAADAYSRLDTRDYSCARENPEHDEAPHQAGYEGRTRDTHDNSIDGEKPDRAESLHQARYDTHDSSVDGEKADRDKPLHQVQYEGQTPDTHGSSLDGEKPDCDEPPQQVQYEGQTSDTHGSSLDGEKPDCDEPPQQVQYEGQTSDTHGSSLDGEKPDCDEPPQKVQYEGQTPDTHGSSLDDKKFNCDEPLQQTLDTHDSSLDGKKPDCEELPEQVRYERESSDTCDMSDDEEEEVAYQPQYAPIFSKDPRFEFKNVNHSTKSAAHEYRGSVNYYYRDNLKYLIIAEMLFAEEEDDEDTYSPDYKQNESYINDATSPEEYLCINFPQWFEDAQKCLGRPYCWCISGPDCVEPPHVAEFPYNPNYSPQPSMYFPYGRRL